MSLNWLFQLFTTAFLLMWCHIGLSIDDSNICWWNRDTNGGNAMALGSKMISNQWKWTPEIIRNGVMVVRWSSDNLRHKNLWIWTKTQKGLNMSAEGVYDQWKNKYVLTNSYWRGHDKGQNDDRIEKWEQKDDSARKWLQNWWCSDCRRRRAAGTGSRSRGSRSSRSRSATWLSSLSLTWFSYFGCEQLGSHQHQQSAWMSSTQL